MKKSFQLLSSLFVVVLLLLGCSTDDATNNTQENEPTNTATENDIQSEESEEETIHLVISDDEEILSDETIEVEEDDILLDILNEHYDVVEDDGFITTIDGVEQNEEEGKFWMYDVNGEMAPVGANELELTPGDEVEFKLQLAE